MKRRLNPLCGIFLSLLTTLICCACGGKANDPGFALLTPGEGKTVETRTPTLTWQDCPGASSYSLLIAADEDFERIMYRAAELTTPAHTVATSLPEDMLCYWRVVARVGGKDVAAEAVRSFRTPASPPPEGGGEGGEEGGGDTPVEGREEKKLNDLYVPDTSLAIPPPLCGSSIRTRRSTFARERSGRPSPCSAWTTLGT